MYESTQTKMRRMSRENPHRFVVPNYVSKLTAGLVPKRDEAGDGVESWRGNLNNSSFSFNKRRKPGDHTVTFAFRSLGDMEAFKAAWPEG